MATLPNTRPTANTYGPDMEDDSAVVDPDLETPAATWNLMREDLAFCGQTSPLSVTSFNGTTAAVVTTRGGAMTCARLGAGEYRVSTSGGWAITDATASIYTSSNVSQPAPNVQLETATSIIVRTFDAAFAAADRDFLVTAY